MNAWIQVDASYPTHRKTRRIARLLGKDARRLPIWLWLYCVVSARDGNLSKLTDADLADVLDYSGDPKKLRAALIEAEFLTADGVVVGWADRYSDKFRFYQERATKAAAARWDRVRSPSTPPPSEQETRKEEIRGEEISKHAEASSKDASSITPTPTAWPVSLSPEQADELALATGKPVAQVNAMWPAFRDREAKFKADYSHPDALAGFRSDLRDAKPFRALSAGEPERWRERLEIIHPGNAINVRGDSWSTVPPQIQAEIMQTDAPRLEARFDRF